MNRSTSLDNEFQYSVKGNRVYDITRKDCLGGGVFVLDLYDFKRSEKLHIHLPDSK